MNCETLTKMLPEIIKAAASKPSQDWDAYHFDDGHQVMDRMSYDVGDEYQVQINRIWKSEKPHIHGCHMMSLILKNGYGWFFLQKGASKASYLWSSPGSIITMEPDDAHWIPELKAPSLSLCVFTKTGDYNKHYKEWPKLTKAEAKVMHEDALCGFFVTGNN